MTTYATNHSRPWLDLVDVLGLTEEVAKRMFDRVEPTKSDEDRLRRIYEIVANVHQARAWKSKE